MQKAISTVTGDEVWAEEFALLPFNEVEANRRSFVCDGCGCPAHFRLPTVRVPHFAGQGHEDDCTLLRDPNADAWENGGEQIVQRMIRNRTKIVLLLPQAVDGDAPDAGAGDLAREAPGDTRRTRGGEGGAANSLRWRRGLRTLLQMLVQSNAFRTSTVPIVLPDGTEVPTNEFFVAFDRAAPGEHRGLYRAYWGVPVHVRRWQLSEGRYVNTIPGRDPNRLSIYLSAALLEPIAQALRLVSVEELEGKYALFLGAPVVTGASGNFQLNVVEPRQIAVRPGPPPPPRPPIARPTMPTPLI